MPVETKNPSGSAPITLSTALKYIFLVVAGIILWLAFTFTLFFALKSIQIHMYQKPGEVLYIGGAIFIFLLLGTLFVPIAAYYLISARFFHNYWKRVSKNDYISPKQMGLLDKFCVVMAVLSILGTALSFNRYLSLGNNYVAFSQAGIFHKRQYYSYNDVRIELEKNQRTNAYEPRFYLRDKILSMGFWGDNELAKNIQEHRNILALNAPYINVEPAAESHNHSFAYFVSIVLMGIGMGLFSRVFARRRKHG